MTFGELRSLLRDSDRRWATRADVPDDRPLPRFPLGATQEGLVPAERPHRFEFRELGPGTNPALAVLRAERGLVGHAEVRTAFNEPLLRRLGIDELPAAPPPAAGAPAGVDWRARWGQNWITTVRDQNPCQSCWAFAGTALVEAMVRIEHATWTRLSEGDPRDGVGKGCGDLGNLGEVSTFFAANGICDPGSWPWHTEARA
ncbi:MAG TPA: C1 family peptidase, partial [Candidatus Binatia bacterium]|nr:C1 family peptidase [Candidatus Binatia bacterium]